MIFCRVALIAIMLLGVGIALGKHGEPKDGTYSFWSTLIAFALEMLLLWGGGFFR